MWQLTKSNFHDLKNEGCSHLAEKYVHAFHWKLVVNSPGTPSCIKLGCYTSDWHCYCEMPLCQDRTLLRATTSSVVFMIDNLKLKSLDNSTFTRAQDLPRCGRPRIITPAQNRYITPFRLRNRTVTAIYIPCLRIISAQTVRNRLRQHGIRPRRPVLT
jgi:hypothetical protein